MNLRFSVLLASSSLAIFTATGACSSDESSQTANDGGASSGQPDASSGGVDASGEAPDAAESGTRDAGNCVDTATTICDDFDQGTSISSKWTQHADSSTLSVSAGGLSAPNALAVTASGRGTAYLEKSFPFTTKVHCELDMKLEKVPVAGTHRLFSITTKLSNGGDYDIAVEQSGTNRGYYFVAQGGALPDGGAAYQQNSLETLPAGRWLHVVFDNDGTKATIDVGGSFSTLIGHAEPTGSSRALKLGVPYDVDVYPEAKILYDNVVCTF